MAAKRRALKKKKPEVVKCDPCDGTGLVKSLGVYGVSPCNVCNGAGVLPAYQGSEDAKSKSLKGGIA